MNSLWNPRLHTPSVIFLSLCVLCDKMGTGLSPRPCQSVLPTLYLLCLPSVTVSTSVFLFISHISCLSPSHRGRGMERWRRRRGRSQRRHLKERNWKNWQKAKRMSLATSSTLMGCLCRMASMSTSKSLGRTENHILTNASRSTNTLFRCKLDDSSFLTPSVDHQATCQPPAQRVICWEVPGV